MDLDLLPDSVARGDAVFLTSELLAAGYTDAMIARMVRSGELHRVRHGSYVVGSLWKDSNEQARHHLTAVAVVRRAKSHVLLSHKSAAVALGAPLWDIPGGVHVTRTDRRAGRREAGVVQHRGVVLADDMTIRNGIQMTSGTRTALDVTTIADVEHSLVVVNGLLHMGETTPELLEHRYSGMDHWPDTLTTDLVLRLADGRCESAGESRTLFLCWKQQLPRPEPQTKIRDGRGNLVARVDFAWPEFGVFLEFDGRVKYQRYLRPGESVVDAVLREKDREQLICGLTGWRCIRIVWADLYRPQLVAARVRAALEGRVWAA